MKTLLRFICDQFILNVNLISLRPE